MPFAPEALVFGAWDPEQIGNRKNISSCGMDTGEGWACIPEPPSCRPCLTWDLRKRKIVTEVGGKNGRQTGREKRIGRMKRERKERRKGRKGKKENIICSL